MLHAFYRCDVHSSKGCGAEGVPESNVHVSMNLGRILLLQSAVCRSHAVHSNRSTQASVEAKALTVTLGAFAGHRVFLWFHTYGTRRRTPRPLVHKDGVDSTAHGQALSAVVHYIVGSAMLVSTAPEV